MIRRVLLAFDLVALLAFGLGLLIHQGCYEPSVLAEPSPLHVHGAHLLGTGRPPRAAARPDDLTEGELQLAGDPRAAYVLCLRVAKDTTEPDPARRDRGRLCAARAALAVGFHLEALRLARQVRDGIDAHLLRGQALLGDGHKAEARLEYARAEALLVAEQVPDTDARLVQARAGRDLSKDTAAPPVPVHVHHARRAEVR